MKQHAENGPISEGGWIDSDELIAILRRQFLNVPKEDLEAVISIHVPKRKLSSAQYFRIFGTVTQEMAKIAPKDTQNTQFLFNSLLQVDDSRIVVRSHPLLPQIDVNSDFKDILGEQFYRKLVTYGSTGLLFQKFEQVVQRSYSFFFWIENRTEIPLNTQGDSLYLQLLKRIWMFQFPEALHLIQMIGVVHEDKEVPAIELGLQTFVEIYTIIVENEELREVFMERKEFAIRYQEGRQEAYRKDVGEFNQKITEIKQKLNFNANYFTSIRGRLVHPCFRAIAQFLSNREDNYVKEADPILTIQELSITDRFFYARRFLRGEDFEQFRNRLIQNYASFCQLEYIVLFGTRRESQVILQNYVDESGDVQKAAVVSIYLRLFLEQGKIGLKDNKIAVYNRFIRDYEFLLGGMDLGMAKHKFDQNCATVQVQRKKNAMDKTFHFNCLNCKKSQWLFSITKYISKDLSQQQQFRMKGKDYYSKDIRNQVMFCQYCMNMLPKCAVCLFPITTYNGYAEELKKNSSLTKPKNCGESLSNALVWCPKCFHGGHFAHVMRWMQRAQKKCPVYSCKCKCSL